MSSHKPAESSPHDQKDDARRWQELARLAQEGDKKAYHRLLKELVPYIQNVLRGSLANPDWVEDITQNVLVSMHKSFHTYAPERPFKPWLLAILSFRKTDFLRQHYKNKENKHVPTDDLNFQKTHVTNPAHMGELKDMEYAMQSLPEKQRHIFKRVRIEGYSMQEVADEMDMSLSAVKVSVHRSTGKIKEMLGQDE